MTMKDKIEDNYEQLLDTLAVQRDELKLKMHLASMDVRDEWEVLEKKWEHIRSKSKHVKVQVDLSAQEVGSAAKLLAQEIKQGYIDIKKSL